MRSTLLLVVFTVGGCASSAVGGVPAGWTLTGSAHTDYALERVRTVDGTAARLAAQTQAPSGFGTLAQVVEAEPYRGLRVRLSAQVEADGVAGRAGLWLRVDGADAVLAFDNMEDRPISGTAASRRYAVVLDVPESAERLAYGVLLSGAGAVVVDNVEVEPVGADVATTDQLEAPLATPPNSAVVLLPRPSNLGFEEQIGRRARLLCSGMVAHLYWRPIPPTKRCAPFSSPPL